MTDANPYVPDTDAALAELRELRELSPLYGFDLFEFLRLLSDAGAPTFEIDGRSAIRADRIIVHYKLNDGLKAVLVALRARQLESCGVKGSPGEVGSLPGRIAGP